jgi:hypothetical protein
MFLAKAVFEKVRRKMSLEHQLKICMTTNWGKLGQIERSITSMSADTNFYALEGS